MRLYVYRCPRKIRVIAGTHSIGQIKQPTTDGVVLKPSAAGTFFHNGNLAVHTDTKQLACHTPRIHGCLIIRWPGGAAGHAGVMGTQGRNVALGHVYGMYERHVLVLRSKSLADGMVCIDVHVFSLKSVRPAWQCVHALTQAYANWKASILEVIRAENSTKVSATHTGS